MKIFCIIGEERSGVAALASGIEAMSGFTSAGEVFHSHPTSAFSKYCLTQRATAGNIIDNEAAFRLYQSFFEILIDDWLKSRFTENGFLFLLKCQTYLAVPALSYYLDTAGVRFLYTARQDDLSCVVAILAAQGVRTEQDLMKLDKSLLDFQVSSLISRRAYFARLAHIRAWPKLITERVFANGFIDNPEVLKVIREFLDVGAMKALFPTTRPTVINPEQRESLVQTLKARFEWLC